MTPEAKRRKIRGDYVHRRAASVMAGEGIDNVMTSILEDFMMEAHTLMQAIKGDEVQVEDKFKSLVQLADAVTKMASSAKKFAPTISELGVAQDVLKQLLEFVRDEYPHHSQAILEIIEPFGEQLTVRFAQ